MAKAAHNTLKILGFSCLLPITNFVLGMIYIWWPPINLDSDKKWGIW